MLEASVRGLLAVASAAPAGAASITRSSGFTYDSNTGLLTQEVIEPDNLVLRLQTDYGYDLHGNKTSATVSGQHVDGVLRIRVEDDACQGPDQVGIELSDQVRALGGTMVLDGAPGRRLVEVVLPCVS